MNIKLTKVLLFVCLLVAHHHLNAGGEEYVSWQKAAPILASAGVVSCVGYGLYSLMAKYLGKHVTHYGPKIGGFISSAVCTGFVVTAITGKNVFDAQSTNTSSSDNSQQVSKQTIPLSGRMGCGIGGLALLFLSWRYWQSCRPGIEFCLTGLLLPNVSLACMAVAIITASKPWYGNPEEKDESTMKHVSKGVAWAVGAVTAGIVSWKYYWQPTIYGV